MSERFSHLSPDFLIEVCSQTDRLRPLREKNNEYIANGTQLAWLIDPENRGIEIFRPGPLTESLPNPESVAGEGPVEGFILSLPPVWDRLKS